MSPGGSNITLNPAKDCVKPCQAYEHDLGRVYEGWGRRVRGWRVDKGDAALSITKKDK